MSDINLNISTSDAEIEIAVAEPTVALEFDIETSQPSVELVVGGPGGMDTEEVNEAIRKYLDDNPYTINGALPDENNDFLINTLTDLEISDLESKIT